MGYNTTIMVLNDRWGEIEKDPARFVKDLTPFINAGVRERRTAGREIGQSVQNEFLFAQTQVIDVAHADATQVIMVGGNTATLLGEAHYTGGHHTREGVKKSLNQVLKQYGLKVIEDTKHTEGLSPGDRT